MSGIYLVVNGYLAAFGCHSANLPYHFGDEHVLFHPDSWLMDMTARVERPKTAILTGACESTEDTTFEDHEDTFLFEKIPSLDRIVQCCGMSNPLVFFGLHSLVNRCCKTGIPLQLWALSQCRYKYIYISLSASEFRQLPPPFRVGWCVWPVSIPSQQVHWAWKSLPMIRRGPSPVPALSLWPPQSFKSMLVLVPLSTVIINPINSILYGFTGFHIYALHWHSQETTPSGCGFQRFGVRCASGWTFAGDLGRFFLPWWHDATRWGCNSTIVIYHVFWGWCIQIPVCTPSMTLWLTILLKLYGNNHHVCSMTDHSGCFPLGYKNDPFRLEVANHQSL